MWKQVVTSVISADLWKQVVTGVVSAALGCGAAGWTVFGKVSAMEATLARIELRVDNLASQRVASK